MNGVTLRAQTMLEDARSADAVIVGSGTKTREIVSNPELMARLGLDPKRQLVAAQCPGTLILAKLGVLGSVPACTRKPKASRPPRPRCTTSQRWARRTRPWPAPCATSHPISAIEALAVGRPTQTQR